MAKEEGSGAAPAAARRARLEVNDTPSQQVTAKAAQIHEVKDERGRRIVLKRPGVLAQYRLVEVLGETAKNEVYMGMVLPVLFVASIDGEPVMPPATKREVEALIQQLDDPGLVAVMEGVQKHFAQTDGASRDKIKN